MEEPVTNPQRTRAQTPARTRSRWPWITTIGAAVLAVSPIGWAFISGAFSGEALSRNIAGPIVMMALAVAVVCGLLEAWVRHAAAQRAAKRAAEQEAK